MVSSVTSDIPCEMPMFTNTVVGNNDDSLFYRHIFEKLNIQKEIKIFPKL